MLANTISLTLNPLFLQHDLMIELGRLEVAIGDVRRAPANSHDELAALETRCATISAALGRLSS